VTSRADIAERFAALEPWSTRFVIDGQRYGGELDYSADERTPTFFRWFDSPRKILELSSFEGVHTLQLAALETTERVLGLEGRSENVSRARLVAELLGRGNIDFSVADLETVDLTTYGHFDAVFCAGLLYHLVSPWRLLAEVARVSDRLFLDTHYWPWHPTVEVDGYRGSFVEEPDDSLSGRSQRSLWLTRPSLLEALTNTGWAVRHLSDHPHWTYAPRLWLGCVRPTALSRTA
jgi:SAM-dependent methyltransferase